MAVVSSKDKSLSHRARGQVQQCTFRPTAMFFDVYIGVVIADSIFKSETTCFQLMAI